MPGVLVIDPIPAPLVERLGPLFPPGAPLAVVSSYSEEDLARHATETEILLVIQRKVDAHLLSSLPRVRFIQRVGVGYDNLDLSALQAAGVVAAYTPGANAVAVAEHTILLMLALLKRFVAAESAARQGGWPPSKKFDKAGHCWYTSWMKNKRLLHPKEAAEELGISTKTIHRWDEAGKLRTVRTVGNQRRIPIEEVVRLRKQAGRAAERCVLYARVSSVRQNQDGNLARQTARLREAANARGYEVVQVITEQASSLNEKRKGMKRLLSLIGEQAVDVVLIEYPDRLVRFGFGYLEQAFGWKDVRLEVLDPPKQQEPTEELIQDMLTIVTVFAGRLYGHRAQGVRKRIETVLKECEQQEETNGASQPHHETAP